MHFHDSFIAHFFPVLSLSCCHKQTSAVLLLFIIHKSNKVASQDGSRRHSRGVLHHSFSYYVLCPYPFRPLSRGSILQPPPVFSCLPACCQCGFEKMEATTPRGLCWPPLSSKFLRASRASVGNVNQMSRLYLFFSIVVVARRRKTRGTQRVDNETRLAV